MEVMSSKKRRVVLQRGRRTGAGICDRERVVRGLRRPKCDRRRECATTFRLESRPSFYLAGFQYARASHCVRTQTRAIRRRRALGREARGPADAFARWPRRVRGGDVVL